MRPDLSTPDSGHGRGVDPKSLGHRGVALGRVPDFDHLNVSKLGHSVIVSLKRIPALAALCLLVGVVVFTGPKEQMVRVDAWRIVATVQRAQSFRDRTVREFPRNSMSAYRDPSNRGFPVSEFITVASPKPAFIGTVFLNLAPKASFERDHIDASARTKQRISSRKRFPAGAASRDLHY